MKIGNLYKKPLTVIIIKMIKEFSKKIYAQSEKSEVLKKIVRKYKEQSIEMNNTITKMKNILEEINSRLTKNGPMNYKTQQWKSLPPNRKRKRAV